MVCGRAGCVGRAEQADELIEQGVQGRFRFGGLFDEQGAVGSLLEKRQVPAQAGVRFQELDFAQGVQLGMAAARKTQIRQIE